MKWRVLSALPLLCLVSLATLTTSPGEARADDFDFSTDDVKKVNKNSPLAQFLEEGKKLYKKRKYKEASLLYYKIISNEGPDAEAFKPEAQYELAKTLYRLKLYQGALQYFGAIVESGETHPYYFSTLRGLVLLTNVIPADQTLLDHLSKFKNYFPAKVPKKYQQQYAYLIGRRLFDRGDYKSAAKLLDAIPETSGYFVNARYTLAVSYAGDYKAKPAVESFKQVMRYLRAVAKERSLTKEERYILELTYMGMGRVFYSAGKGNYNKAIKYYSKIPRTSRNWPKALFEMSWVYFQQDNFNEALGNLHTLNSPFFTDSYFPETPILSATLFFYNCKYSRVRYELDEFSYTYEPIKDKITKILDDNKDEDKIIAWLRKQQAGKAGIEDEQLRRILAASLDDRTLTSKLDLLKSMETEDKTLSRMPKSWKDSPLGLNMLQSSALAKSDATSNAANQITKRLERIRNQLVDLVVKRERILVEVARAEKGEVDADLKAGMVVKATESKKRNIKPNDEELFWRFDGEYWRDELGFYIFNTTSKCKR